MYIAIQVQSCKEKSILENMEKMIKLFGLTGIKVHFFEKSIYRLINNKIKEIKKAVIPGYLIAEIDKPDDRTYYFLARTSGVIRVFWKAPLSQEEFARLQDEANREIIEIKEPEMPKFKEKSVLKALKKALANTIDQKVADKVKRLMERMRQRQRQFQLYLRHLSQLKEFKRFTGRSYVFEFPLDVFVKASRCLPVGVPFLSNPVLLAIKMAQIK